MAEVKLWKKQAKYVDKDGQERTATNFFVQCGEIRKIVFIEKCLMSYGVYAISLLPLFIKIFPVFPIFPIF